MKAASDGDKNVRCVACKQTIKRESISAHLKSASHRKCAEVLEATKNEAREQARAEEAEREHIEFIQLEASRSVPMDTKTGASRPGCMNTTTEKSAAERAIWENFEREGADFTMDDGGIAQSERQRAQWREEIKTFGIWNPERSAAELGFQIGSDAGSQAEDILGLGAIAEEDAFLADLLSNNARAYSLLYWPANGVLSGHFCTLQTSMHLTQRMSYTQTLKMQRLRMCHRTILTLRTFRIPIIQYVHLICILASRANRYWFSASDVLDGYHGQHPSHPHL